MTNGSKKTVLLSWRLVNQEGIQLMSASPCHRSLQVRTLRICSWRRGRRRCVRRRRRNTKSRCQSLVSSTPTRSQRRCVTEHQINQTVPYRNKQSVTPTKTKKSTCAWREALSRPNRCLTKTMPTCNLLLSPLWPFLHNPHFLRDFCVISLQNC